MNLAKEMRQLSLSAEAKENIRKREEAEKAAEDAEFKAATDEILKAAREGYTCTDIRLGSYEDEVVKRLKAEGFTIEQTRYINRIEVWW